MRQQLETVVDKNFKNHNKRVVPHSAFISDFDSWILSYVQICMHRCRETCSYLEFIFTLCYCVICFNWRCVLLLCLVQPEAKRGGGGGGTLKIKKWQTDRVERFVYFLKLKEKLKEKRRDSWIIWRHFRVVWVLSLCLGGKFQLSLKKAAPQLSGFYIPSLLHCLPIRNMFLVWLLLRRKSCHVMIMVIITCLSLNIFKTTVTDWETEHWRIITQKSRSKPIIWLGHLSSLLLSLSLFSHIKYYNTTLTSCHFQFLLSHNGTSMN